MATRTGWALTTAMAAVLALLAPAAARAAVSFERTDYTVGNAATSLAVGDIDGKDGPDIVAATYPAGVLVRRLNDGTGHFATSGQSYTACPSTQVELADVTSNGTDFVRDGKLDALLFCDDSGAIARMAGDGAGGFGAPHLSMFLNSPSLASNDHFVLGKFTDYDRPPLLVYRTQDGSYHGVACVLYDYTTDYQCLGPGGAYPAHITGPMVAADFRGDGMEELATLGGSRGIVIFGVTSYPNRVWSESEADFGHSGANGNIMLTTGDLRADGHTDLVTGWSTSSEGWVNTIDVTDQGAQHSAPRSFPSVPGMSKLVTGDFDADGTLDVMAATGYGRVVVHAGDRAGGLGGPQDVPLLGYGDPAKATVADAVTADVDRNGTDDAVVLDELLGQFEVLRNLAAAPVKPPPGGGSPAPIVTPPPPAPGPKPAPKPAPFGGVTQLVSALTVPRTGALTLGRASNPPTRQVVLTLTVPGASTSATKRHAKPVVVGRATIAIPAGKSRPLAVRLTTKGRTLTRRHARVRATLTLVATATDGTKQTRTRAVTLKRRAAKH